MLHLECRSLFFFVFTAEISLRSCLVSTAYTYDSLVTTVGIEFTSFALWIKSLPTSCAIYICVLSRNKTSFFGLGVSEGVALLEGSCSSRFRGPIQQFFLQKQHCMLFCEGKAKATKSQ